MAEENDMQNTTKREYIVSACFLGAGIGLWLLAAMLQAFDNSFRIVWIIPFVIRAFGAVIFIAGSLRMFNTRRGNPAGVKPHA